MNGSMAFIHNYVYQVLVIKQICQSNIYVFWSVENYLDVLNKKHAIDGPFISDDSDEFTTLHYISFQYIKQYFYGLIVGV